MGKIRSQDFGRRGFSAKGERHVAGTTTQIKHPGIRLRKDLSKAAGCSSPPPPIHVEREHMIQQIVAGRNRREHLTDGMGCRLWITGACRSSADDRGRPRRLFRGTVGRIRNGYHE